MDYTQIISVPVIVAVVYAMIEMLKRMTNYNKIVVKLLPLIALGLGVVLGIVSYYAVPLYKETSNIIFAIVVGAVSGLSATGTNQIIQKLAEKSIKSAKSIITEDSTPTEKVADLQEVAKDTFATIKDENSDVSKTIADILDTATGITEVLASEDSSALETISSVVSMLDIGEITPTKDSTPTENTDK